MMKNYKNITPTSGINDLVAGNMKHQEGPFYPGMEMFFLAIIIVAETLDTKQLIANSMQETTI